MEDTIASMRALSTPPETVRSKHCSKNSKKKPFILLSVVVLREGTISWNRSRMSSKMAFGYGIAIVLMTLYRKSSSTAVVITDLFSL